MNGIRTGIILGAGASFCYEDGSSNIPSQKDITGRLFIGLDTSSGEGFPTFISTSGMKHSFQLGQYLRKRFKIPENSEKKFAKLDFWNILQERGYTLETLFAELEEDDEGKLLLDEFQAIIRTAVIEPNEKRDINSVCRYHRMLCEVLEPGDYIINFNWDSLMADALLYYSHFWFPVSGFGIPNVFPLMRPCQKSHHVNSLVYLFHVHGSVVLFELIHDRGEKQSHSILYLGPNTYSAGNSYLAYFESQKKKEVKEEKCDIEVARRQEDEDTYKLAVGYLYYQDLWFRPIFSPPSRYKKEYGHWYMSHIRKNIHRLLPTTKQFIVAGYSFPDSDIDHLNQLFVRDVIDININLVVINPSNDEESFRSRVSNIFPYIKEIDYSVKDFRQFCLNLRNSKPH